MTSSIRMRDVTIRDGLAIVTVDGFEPEKLDEEEAAQGPVDLPGSANWLVEQYGMADEPEGSGSGILWCDYDLAGTWLFSVLIDSGEADAFSALAREAGYEVEKVEPITEPTHYGDGTSGTVEILKHRDGWVVIPN